MNEEAVLTEHEKNQEQGHPITPDDLMNLTISLETQTADEFIRRLNHGSDQNR